jgi:hypothetical protein
MSYLDVAEEQVCRDAGQYGHRLTVFSVKQPSGMPVKVNYRCAHCPLLLCAYVWQTGAINLSYNFELRQTCAGART